MRRKTIAAAAIVPDVIQAVDRCGDASESFFLYRGKELARIAPSTQTARCDRCHIETALSSEARFHRRVIKRANNEVSSGVTLRSTGQRFVLAREPDLRFRPWDIGEEVSAKVQENSAGESENSQSPKKAVTGPPSKTSIGKRSYSYS